MPDIATLTNQYGLTIALVLYFLAKELWPFFKSKVFPEWVQERRKDTVEREKQAGEYRTLMLEEIKSLREEAKIDKRLLLKTFIDNTQATTELKSTLQAITVQMHELTDEVIQQKQDIASIYAVLSSLRGLTEKK